MSFLIPIGVVCYAAIGGLKATFTTSYMHTVIIYIVCLVLMLKVGVMTVFTLSANTPPWDANKALPDARQHFTSYA